MILLAQATNAVANSAPGQQTPQDIAKVFQDFGVHADIPTIGGVLFIVYAVAKLIRNKTPLGNTAFGNILSSVVNLEAKTPPSAIPAQNSGIPVAAQPPKPTV